MEKKTANSYTVTRTKGGLRTMCSPYNNIIIGQLVKHNFPRRRSHFCFPSATQRRPSSYPTTTIIMGCQRRNLLSRLIDLHSYTHTMGLKRGTF